jgi:hypothetical protein
VLDAIAREFDLLERAYHGQLPDMIVYKFDKRPLLERAAITLEALMAQLAQGDKYSYYAEWYINLLRSREKGARIPEEDRTGFAFCLSAGDWVQISYLTTERDKFDSPRNDEDRSSDEDSGSDSGPEDVAVKSVVKKVEPAEPPEASMWAGQPIWEKLREISMERLEELAYELCRQSNVRRTPMLNEFVAEHRRRTCGITSTEETFLKQLLGCVKDISNRMGFLDTRPIYERMGLTSTNALYEFLKKHPGFIRPDKLAPAAMQYKEFQLLAISRGCSMAAV